MLVQNLPPFKVQRFPFDSSFDTYLLNHGYQLAMKVEDFSIFYQFNKKFPFIKRTSSTLLWIIKINNKNLQTNDERIDNQIEIIKQNFSMKTPHLNELTLTFKLVDFLTNTNIDSFQEIVNYSSNNRTIISLPCAAILENKSVYTLRPQKVYPNKYYFVLVQTLFLITNASGLSK
jgi:hypothetical protein